MQTRSRQNVDHKHINIARDMIEAIGGTENVIGCSMFMTRLRLLLDDVSRIDVDRLNAIHSVLGVSRRSAHGFDVIFVPSVIDGVYQDFIELTQPLETDKEIEDSPVEDVPVTTASVQVAVPAYTPPYPPESTDSISHSLLQTDALSSMLEGLDLAPDTPRQAVYNNPEQEPMQEHKSILVLNGPNLNMLGVREPDIYGSQSYMQLENICHEAAAEAGFSTCRCFQSNHEGDLIDEIQDALGTYEAIVINPGGYTHTSVALLDALKAVKIPAIEVHISKVDEREEFRQISYVRLACIDTIIGLGLDGYRVAIQRLAQHLGMDTC